MTIHNSLNSHSDLVDTNRVIDDLKKFLLKPTDYPLYETSALIRRALHVIELLNSDSKNV